MLPTYSLSPQLPIVPRTPPRGRQLFPGEDARVWFWRVAQEQSRISTYKFARLLSKFKFSARPFHPVPSNQRVNTRMHPRTNAAQIIPNPVIAPPSLASTQNGENWREALGGKKQASVMTEECWEEIASCRYTTRLEQENQRERDKRDLTAGYRNKKDEAKTPGERKKKNDRSVIPRFQPAGTLPSVPSTGRRESGSQKHKASKPVERPTDRVFK